VQGGFQKSEQIGVFTEVMKKDEVRVHVEKPTREKHRGLVE
jgi:hypothetical protein